jgi:hypothetical protein
MGSDRDIVALADYVDILVGRLRDNIDVGTASEKVRHDVAHRELRGSDGGGAADGASRFTHEATGRVSARRSKIRPVGISGLQA